MAYLFLTNHYRAHESSYNKRLVLRKLDELRESDDPRLLMERFGALPVFKEQADNFRIIIQEVNITLHSQKYDIFCVKRVIPRGSNEYLTFQWLQHVADWLKDNPISKSEMEDIHNWLEEQLEMERLSHALPELPDALKPWMNVQDMYVSKSTIYETQEWTESIKEKYIYDFKETICNALLEIVDQSPLNIIWRRCNLRNIVLASFKNQIYILFERTETRILVLYKVFRKDAPSEEAIETLLRNYAYNENPQREDLIRDAKRAYPDYILLEPELWFKIQEDSSANLALSPEEENLLQNATFPLFINGQAGSGKSTMLFYLFAHYCSLSGPDNELHPLFLTYNKRLLETAKKNVTAILGRHPNYLELNMDTQRVQKYFYPFQDFILEYLVEPEDRLLFSKQNYISFSKFKQCFLGESSNKALNCQLPNKRNYSAELVWHIIRTYIKGYDFQSDFPIGAYEQLPKKDKSVLPDKYKDVFQTIWSNWYAKFYEKQGLWDDQDLIRYVLNRKDFHFPQYPAVFCDEAQDFTKIEIELLLKLSCFTKYNLAHHAHIPFSFAGDPYQTINPTGFRWETLKTIFNDRFKKLNPQGLEIRFESLSQNYRSKPAIIKFTNLIQGFRHWHLKIQELRPQMAWQKMEGVSPCLFVVHQDIHAEQLKAVADKTILLIPTDADENKEYEYVENDAVLNQFIQLPKDKNTPIPNVMSASSSKGLEFDRVVLYHFGAVAPESFQKIIAREELDNSEFIELGHYFNKLYVALSRARNYLFILDTEAGYQKFWKHFMNVHLLKESFERQQYWFEKDVAPLSRGVRADVDNIKEENPLKVAQELEDNGRSQQNYTLLQRAEQYFKLEGKELDALRCAAWSNWYRERWEIAGQQFEQINEPQFASDAYWRGQHWQSLFLQTEQVIRKQVASYMLNEVSIEVFFDNALFWEVFNANDEVWQTVIQKIRLDIEKATSEKRLSYATFAQQLGKRKLKGFYPLAAQLYYKDEYFESAIQCWNLQCTTEHTEYYLAKLKITHEVNEKITWLQRLRNDSAIVELYQKMTDNARLTLSNANQQGIFDILLRKNEFEEALNHAFYPLAQRVRRVLDSLREFRSEDLVRKQKERIFNLLLENEALGVDIIKTHVKTFQDFFNNKKAIMLILNQENWQDLLDDLDKELRTALRGKFIESFVDIVCEELEQKKVVRLFYAIDRVGELRKTDDRLTEYVKLVKAIAYSDVTPEMFSVPEREKLEKFVMECVLQRNTWGKEVTYKEIWTGLERLGAKSTLLQFEVYGKIMEDSPSLGDWAKLRWLKVAERRLNYELERSARRNDRIDRIRNTMDEKMLEWNMEVSKIRHAPEYPILDKPFIYQNLEIYGLDYAPKTRLQRVTFEVQQYEIRVHCKTKMVSVEDMETGHSIDMDVEQSALEGVHFDRDGAVFKWAAHSGEFVNASEIKLNISLLKLRIVFN